MLKRALRRTGTAPYHDLQRAGLVRYMQVVVERSSQRVQLVVVCNSESAAPVRELFDELERSLRGVAHSLWFNGNTANTNAIVGDVWQRLSGPPAVEETIAGARVFYPPDAFGQANLDLFERIVQRIHEWVPHSRRLLEYHAGVGAIGLGLVERAVSVDFVEISSGGLTGLKFGLDALNAEQRGRTRLHRGAAADHVSLLSRADVVIVDPPRKGLEAPLVEALCREPPERLIYLSCGLSSFERDARTLSESGAFALRQVEPYALFPYTEHVETLALFERRAGKRPIE